MTAPSPRPLYLDSRQTLRIVVEDEALRLHQDGKAERWLPLVRVSRIIANRHAEFTTEALLACGEYGITVVFLDQDGDPLVRLMGQPGERQVLHQRLLDLFDRPDGADRYRDWLRAERRRASSQVLARLGLDAQVHNHEQARLRLESVAATLGSPEDIVHSRQFLRALAMAWAVNHIRQLGIGAGSEALQDGFPDLASDLGDLLTWHAETLRLGYLLRRHLWIQRSGKQPRALTRKQMVKLWERNGARMGRTGRGISNRLHRWLIDTAN